MTENLKKTEKDYLTLIGDIISNYKNGNLELAKKDYESIPEHEIVDMPHVYSLHLNLGYILDDHPILNTESLLNEVIIEYLNEKKKYYSEVE